MFVLFLVVLFLSQISQFNEEMAKLSDSVKSMQSKCALAKDNEELDALRKETGLIGRTLVAINDTTKVCSNWKPKCISLLINLLLEEFLKEGGYDRVAC